MMNEYTRNKIEAFMEVLIELGLEKDHVCGICSMMKTEEMMLEILDRLEAREFKLTPQETLNICGKVIMENQ